MARNCGLGNAYSQYRYPVVRRFCGDAELETSMAWTAFWPWVLLSCNGPLPESLQIRAICVHANVLRMVSEQKCSRTTKLVRQASL